MTSAKYGLAVASVAVTAAGLNLGVLQLGGGSSEVTLSDPQPSQTTSAPDAPVQVVVDVPVLVPTSSAPASSTDATAPSPERAGNATTAAPLPETSTATAAAKATSAAPPPTAAPPATTAPPAVTANPPPTTLPATTTPPTTTTENVPATQYLYYTFPGVASELIVAQHGDGSLEFWSVTPDEGWNYRVEKNSASKVEVKFSRAPNGEGEAKFVLEREGDDLEVKKER